MSLTPDDIRRIARLARLAVSDAEIPALTQDLNRILSFVAELQAVPTEGVAPMGSPVRHAMAWREDAVTAGGQPQQILTNAPEKTGGFFVVPKVVE